MKIMGFFVILLLLISIDSIEADRVDGRFIENTRSVEFNMETGELKVDGNIDGNASYWPIVNTSLSNITPNFQIISIANKRSINGGDDFSISFHISGLGKVIKNKLIVYFPKVMLKEDPIWYSYLSEIRDSDTNEITGGVWHDDYPHVSRGSTEAAFIKLLGINFLPTDRNIDIVFGEDVVNTHRPITIEGITKDDIPSGDHIINVILFYSDGEEWFSSQDEVLIHVNTWEEEHQEENFFRGSIVIPILTTITGAFLGAVLPLLFVYYLIKRRERKKHQKLISSENNIKNITPKKKEKKIKKTDK